MKESEKKTSAQNEGLHKQDEAIKMEIISILKKIKVPTELERIRRFVTYIYIHH